MIIGTSQKKQEIYLQISYYDNGRLNSTPKLYCNIRILQKVVFWMYFDIFGRQLFDFYDGHQNICLYFLAQFHIFPQNQSQPYGIIQQLQIIMSQALTLLSNLILSIDQSYEPQSIASLDIAFGTLDEILQEQPQAIAKKMDQLLDAFEACLSEHPTVTLMTITRLYAMLIDVVGAYTKLAKNNKNRLVRILRGAINTITKVSYEIEENWLNPPNGYSEDTASDESLDSQKEILRNIDSICDTVGRSLIASTFQAIFQQSIGIQTDWRYPYAALMVASQFSGKKIKLQKLHGYVESSVKLMENPNPKIRYACFHLLGQYSDEMKPEFQQKYYNFLIPSFIKFLQDPVPRVLSHDLACLTNFFEDMNEVWNIQSCLGQILPPVLHYLKTGNSWLREGAASTLAALATTKDAFGPNLTQILEIANETITAHAGQPEFTQLINQSFQLISLALVYQKLEDVSQYVQGYVNLLLNHRNQMSCVYFLNAWGRVCYRYESFIDISIVFDTLMEAVQQVLNEETDEQAEEALSSLSFTCLSFKTKLFPYMERIITIAKLAFEDKDRSQSLRQRALSIIVKAVVETYCQTPELYQIWQNLTKMSIQYIVNCIDSVQQTFQELSFLYEALRDLIKISINIFSQAQIHEFALKLQGYKDKTYTLCKQFQTRKNTIEGSYQGNEVEQDESQVNALQTGLDELTGSTQNISQIYQSLLNVSDPACRQWLISFLMQEGAKYINEGNDWKLLSLSLFITILEKAKYNEVKQIWPNLLTLCITNSSHRHTRIRNMAIYGLGMMVEGTPVELTQQEDVMSWLQSLWSAFTAPYEQDLDDRLIEHSNENIVSTLGKLLYKYGQKFTVMLNQQIYKHWLSKLPLNNDKIEGNIQQQYLIELLAKNPGMLVSNSEDLKKICVIYASFILKRHDSIEQVMNKTKESLKAIMNWPLFKESENYLWNNLTSSQINCLTRFIAN